MLTELRVENLGIIAELHVALGSGMTAITGETGAGKTLIVGALELLCGGRAEPSVVRDGADEARVEGRFEHGPDEYVLARVVPATGRSRGYINGRLATAGELSDLGRALVDLHGQHAHQSLLAPVEQRALLDQFVGAKAAAALTAIRSARAVGRALTEQIRALGGDEQSRAREVDLLRYQVEEIAGAEIVDDEEDARLAREAEWLADAEEHREALNTAYDALEGPAADGLGAAIAALAGRAPFQDLVDRVRALQSEVQEAGHDARAARESATADPERLATINARRAVLRELIRKYGPTLPDVIAYGSEMQVRLADLEQHDTRAAQLESDRRDAHAAAEKAAKSLTKLRAAAAPKLVDAVTGHLRELAMPAASFGIEIEPAALGDDGADDITFVLAPNPGESARPLARAASGGELARTMLAMRLVLSEAPPTLVFDEVDAGIGGEAGVAVGRALASLGGQHQVMCVTHLAQVAAFADAHVVVAKDEVGGRTVATASLLLDGARTNEISRMLAGGDSSNARRHAKELMTAAADQRRLARAGSHPS